MDCPNNGVTITNRRHLSWNMSPIQRGIELDLTEYIYPRRPRRTAAAAAAAGRQSGRA